MLGSFGAFAVESYAIDIFVWLLLIGVTVAVVCCLCELLGENSPRVLTRDSPSPPRRAHTVRYFSPQPLRLPSGQTITIYGRTD